MKCSNCLVALVVVVFIAVVVDATKYEPNWASIDSRPLPDWYDKAKVGIFIHWGVFSVPSFRSEWFWWYWQGDLKPDVVDFMKKNYPPGFTYAEFAPMFTAEFFDPDYWADLFQESGAKYIVLTSKHHEGFCLWPSKVSFNWNAKDIGPKRDLVGALANSIRKRTDIRFGLYHSLFEWFNPIYWSDALSGYSKQEFVAAKTMPELYELIENYKPDLLWSDGDAGPDIYWNSTQFLAWLYNESPVKDTVVTNDRWGNNGMACHHGGYYTCDDRYNPGTLQRHKWENCFTIDSSSWGYRRNAKINEYLTIEDIISTVVETVSCGGNALINVGPTREGTIAPIFQQRLRDLGSWLKVNGEAIYETQAWRFQNDTINSDVWYTSKNDSVYGILVREPDESVRFGALAFYNFADVKLLGFPGRLNWIKTNDSVIVYTNMRVPASQVRWSWTFQFTHVTNP